MLVVLSDFADTWVPFVHLALKQNAGAPERENQSRNDNQLIVPGAFSGMLFEKYMNVSIREWTWQITLK